MRNKKQEYADLEYIYLTKMNELRHKPSHWFVVKKWYADELEKLDAEWEKMESSN